MRARSRFLDWVSGTEFFNASQRNYANYKFRNNHLMLSTCIALRCSVFFVVENERQLGSSGRDGDKFRRAESVLWHWHSSDDRFEFPAPAMPEKLPQFTLPGTDECFGIDQKNLLDYKPLACTKLNNILVDEITFRCILYLDCSDNQVIRLYGLPSRCDSKLEETSLKNVNVNYSLPWPDNWYSILL